MEEILLILSENAFEILTSAAIILCTFLNKPKTAEKIKAAKVKRYQAIERKEQATAEKAKLAVDKMEAKKKQLEKELNEHA